MRLRHAIIILASAANLSAAIAPADGDQVGVEGLSSSLFTEGEDRVLVSNSLMFFDSETEQGDQELPGGTTIYDQLSVQYSFGRYFSALGLTYHWDQLGESQTNTGFGLKGEVALRGLYLELGYGTTSQSFKNRAAKSRTGTQTTKAFGIRVPFVQNLLFFDGGIRQRDSVFDKQDGAKLRNKVRESIFMPFVGFGLYL